MLVHQASCRKECPGHERHGTKVMPMIAVGTDPERSGNALHIGVRVVELSPQDGVPRVMSHRKTPLQQEAARRSIPVHHFTEGEEVRKALE